MKIKITLFIISIFIAFVAFSTARAEEKLDVEGLKQAVDASLKAEGRKLGDYTLTDQDGKAFQLAEYFKAGRPLVVSFIYTSCPVICPGITAELYKASEEAWKKLGPGKFNVLTIGFDTENDTPAKLKEYGARFTGDFASFRFAAADPETMKRLIADFGFYMSKRNDGSFDHIDMVTVVRPDGTIYKQAYSIRTQASSVGARVEELVTGKPFSAGPASLVDKIKFFCYKYDPYTGKYVIDYPIIISVALQAGVILFIVFAVWGRRIKGVFRKKA